jgi:hypothetical protein
MHYWHIANGIVSGIGAFVLALVVMHPRIEEGLIVKVGLVVMVFSLFATAYLSLVESENWVAYWRAAFWLRAGLLITAAGVLTRSQGWFGGPKRRMSDWVRIQGHNRLTRKADT